jgi:hypothetical protein
MKPAIQNLTIYRGSEFIQVIQWLTGDPQTPVDLTGCSARMHIRKSITDEVILCELSTANSKITWLDALNGKLQLHISSVETATFDFMRGVYDLEIVYPLGQPCYRIMQGQILVDYNVTR